MCASGEWGPAKAIRHFNIHPLTHFQAIFETHNLPVIIKFKCPKLLKFHVKLSSNQYSSSNDNNSASSTTTSNGLDKYVQYEYDEHNYIVSFIIQLPAEGQYGIDIYARDPDYQAEKRTMSHCCKYIINYSKSPMIDTTSNVNNQHHHTHNDYAFDRTRSNGQQQKLVSPRKSRKIKNNKI